MLKSMLAASVILIKLKTFQQTYSQHVDLNIYVILLRHYMECSKQEFNNILMGSLKPPCSQTSSFHLLSHALSARRLMSAYTSPISCLVTVFLFKPFQKFTFALQNTRTLDSAWQSPEQCAEINKVLNLGLRVLLCH